MLVEVITFLNFEFGMKSFEYSFGVPSDSECQLQLLRIQTFILIHGTSNFMKYNILSQLLNY